MTTIAGGTITAAEELINGAFISINWCGGWHHAQRYKSLFAPKIYFEIYLFYITATRRKDSVISMIFASVFKDYERNSNEFSTSTWTYIMVMGWRMLFHTANVYSRFRSINTRLDFILELVVLMKLVLDLAKVIVAIFPTKVSFLESFSVAILNGMPVTICKNFDLVLLTIRQSCNVC